MIMVFYFTVWYSINSDLFDNMILWPLKNIWYLMFYNFYIYFGEKKFNLLNTATNPQSVRPAMSILRLSYFDVLMFSYSDILISLFSDILMFWYLDNLNAATNPQSVRPAMSIDMFWAMAINIQPRTIGTVENYYLTNLRLNVYLVFWNVLDSENQNYVWNLQNINDDWLS